MNRVAAGRSRRGLPVDVLFAIGVLVVAFAAAAWVISLGRQLTWDEAVYATKARSLTSAIPASFWRIYRPPGLPYLALAAAPFGYSDMTVRLVSASAGVLSVAAAWALARTLWGAGAAVLVILAVLACPTVLWALSAFRNDLVSLGPLLLLLLVLWWQLERTATPNAWLLVAAPLAAAAFYVRYGSLASIGGVAVMALVLWRAKLWRHRALVAGTIVLFAVLLIPHVADAVSRTGSPLGIVQASAVATDTTSPLAALRRYVVWFPRSIGGPVGLAFAVAAAVFALIAVRDSIHARRLTPDARRLTLLLIPAAVSGLGIVLISHPEARYLMGPLVLGVVAGGGAIAAGLPRAGAALDLPPARRRLAAAVLVAALVVAAAAAAINHFNGNARVANRHWLAKAGAVIAAEPHDSCLVVATEVPIAGWYARCVAIPFSANLQAARADLPPSAADYVVFTSRDAGFTSAANLERYRQLVSQPPVGMIVEPETTSTVYRLPPAP
jgi:4-amino-4-deoxy-L-arabinose transferase-like glycosyltransferase